LLYCLKPSSIPLGNDQPGVAARIRYHQLGVSFPSKQLSVERLRQALITVLNHEIYGNNARKFAQEIVDKPGLALAVNTIEQLIPNQQK
jgi:zeaxanthin glucosyltransferase